MSETSLLLFWVKGGVWVLLVGGSKYMYLCSEGGRKRGWIGRGSQ